jgi:hypothetical protein
MKDEITVIVLKLLLLCGNMHLCLSPEMFSGKESLVIVVGELLLLLELRDMFYMISVLIIIVMLVVRKNKMIKEIKPIGYILHFVLALLVMFNH